MGVLYARETPNDNFEPVSTIGVGNASQSQRGLMTVPDKIKLDGIADYIVEQGTSGTWTYRKWNSGIAECWGTYDAIQVSISTSWGNGYYGAKQSNNTFPTGLFAHWPTLLVSNLTGDGVWYSIVDLTKESFGYYPFCVNSGTRNLRIMAHAIGTWK